MAWLYLLVAGVFEIVWAIGLKYSDGFTRVVPILVVIGGMAVSLVFLAIAMRSIPVGTAYAVWTGIGAAGTAVVAMFLFGESAAPLRLACLGLIVGGIIGLKLVTAD
jgi:quaternary ammonium compound-resistance protein SugE